MKEKAERRISDKMEMKMNMNGCWIKIRGKEELKKC